MKEAKKNKHVNNGNEKWCQLVLLRVEHLNSDAPTSKTNDQPTQVLSSAIAPDDKGDDADPKIDAQRNVDMIPLHNLICFTIIY